MMNIKISVGQKRPALSRSIRLASALALMTLGIATALAQTTTLESVNTAGVKGDRGSWYPSISEDGRHVTFVSEAQNLAPGLPDSGDPDPCQYPGDPVNCLHIFVRDRFLGTTARISVNAAGEQGNGHSYYPSISANGRFVTFNSFSNNLVPGDIYPNAACQHCGLDVFVHDRDADGNGIFDEPGGIALHRIGNISQASFVYPNAISGDGRFVVFGSVGFNAARAGQVYLWDMQDDSVLLVSADGNGVARSDYPAISDDGSTIAYISWARMVPEDTNGDPGEISGCLSPPTVPCGADVYVYNRLTGETTRASVDSDGQQANGPSVGFPLSLSADGRFIGFGSRASNLVGDDNNDREDIFVHDRVTGETVLASRNNLGLPGDDNSRWPSLSADGRRVSFASWAENLAPNGQYGGSDVFLRDLLLGRTRLVSAGMNGAVPTGSSWDPNLSGTGRFVAFWSTAWNLAPGDGGGSQDIFVTDMFGHDCPGGEQGSGSELGYIGDLLVGLAGSATAQVTLAGSLGDSSQEPIPDEWISVAIEGSGGTTAFDCGPTAADGTFACSADLAPDVYRVSLSFAGNDCNSAAEESALVVVYDPNQPRATGGGFFYPDAESTLPGYGSDKAHFGFVAYVDKQSAAGGSLEFQYQAAGINLRSQQMQWYTLSSNRAMFQGLASINGGGAFTFRVQAIDGGDYVSADHLDIRIWQGTDTESEPIHRAKNTLAGGNIMIHKR